MLCPGGRTQHAALDGIPDGLRTALLYRQIRLFAADGACYGNNLFLQKRGKRQISQCVRPPGRRQHQRHPVYRQRHRLTAVQAAIYILCFFAPDADDLISEKSNGYVSLRPGTIPAFRQFYILRHPDSLMLNSTYPNHPKPFLTTITFTVAFSGVIS